MPASVRSTNPATTWQPLAVLPASCLQRVEVLLDELPTQDEVLGRVAGDRELGEHHEVGAGLGGAGGGVGHARHVAGEVADGEVQLPERDASHDGSLRQDASRGRALKQPKAVARRKAIYSVPPMSTL